MATDEKQESGDFIQKLEKEYGGDNLFQWINIKASTDKILKHSENIKKTSEYIYFDGKNGFVEYSLPLKNFNIHYDCDLNQNVSCWIAFYCAICYTSKDERPIFLSIDGRITESLLCPEIIGDFTAKTASWKLYGPFCIDLSDDHDDEVLNVKFSTSYYFPHILEFKFIPTTVYNLPKKEKIYKAINWMKIMEKNKNENKSTTQNLDMMIVEAVKRRSFQKSKSYRNFTSNILLYADLTNVDKIVKPNNLSKNMKYGDNKKQYIHCDGKNGFIEYDAKIIMHDKCTMFKTYDHSFDLTLAIEYFSLSSCPLELYVNKDLKLSNLCKDIVKLSYDQSASWRIYNFTVQSTKCQIRLNTTFDTYQFPIKLQSKQDGLFPNIKSIMVMHNINVPLPAASSSSSSIDSSNEQKKEEKEEKKESVDDDEDDGVNKSDSDSFLKLATAYKNFITPPTDLITFEPFISSVRNICFDTYLTANSVCVSNDDDKKKEEKKEEKDDDDEKKNEYPDVGITLNNEMFVPDSNFYESYNCDGLWICVSKNCPDYKQLLDEAKFLVKSFVPIEIRRLFLKYKHGQYRPRYVGPMRLIILSHKNNEQAGCIPELKTKETGRNGTAQPFVFSSSDDFNHGFYDHKWFNGHLTAHELVHAVDMVIRQLIDPCFMVECDKIYNLAKKSGKYPEKCYAMTSRHEYIAEILTVFLNIPPNDLYVAGFKNKNDLKEKDIAGYQFLQKWFLEINHTLPVLDVYKKFKKTL